MEMVIQGLIALIALALFGLGTKSMFAPKSMLKNFAIEPVGTAGLNTIRGVLRLASNHCGKRARPG